MFNIVRGNILDAEEQFIVHQCNCRTFRSAGLAKALFDKYPNTNIYNDGTVRVPGTIIIRDRIINLLAQDQPGKSSRQETQEQREKWFFDGLAQIERIDGLESIAFPYGIGCGLAGGNWSVYFSMISAFNKRNPQIKVVIYQL